MNDILQRMKLRNGITAPKRAEKKIGKKIGAKKPKPKKKKPKGPAQQPPDPNSNRQKRKNKNRWKKPRAAQTKKTVHDTDKQEIRVFVDEFMGISPPEDLFYRKVGARAVKAYYKRAIDAGIDGQAHEAHPEFVRCDRPGKYTVAVYDRQADGQLIREAIMAELIEWKDHLWVKELLAGVMITRGS